MTDARRGAELSGQRKKTVAFYEIVRAKDAGNLRFDHIDWGFVLDNLSALSVHDRHMMHDDDIYVGEPIESSNGKHLVLARLRDGDLQQIDYEAQRIDALRLDGNRSVVDTTIICFLPYGNVIGVIQGSASAPRPTALQRWLNAMHSGIGEDLAIIPLIGRNAWEKLKAAESVNLFEMRLRPAGTSMFPISLEGLGDFAHHAHKQNPDALITLTIKIPKGRGLSRSSARARGERRLHASVQEFLSDFGSLVGPHGVIDRAIADVMLSASDGSIVEEKINFVNDHITASKQVTLPRGSGAGPWFEAAVQAVMQAASEHDSDLRSAVSAMP
ncbi:MULTISPECIES: hypothetical protein [unclassified Streptomyces]|uniref:hypothetical protein n=1 Tax=unclassified Streptomyces TaxID=2593676 RepID=UPI00131B0D1D|nr:MULTISPECIES: hypothetical protein [unclassified Streptomyces]MYX24920.1 hypothetical protein [Streptomyces sp. SID8380]